MTEASTAPCPVHDPERIEVAEPKKPIRFVECACTYRVIVWDSSPGAIDTRDLTGAIPVPLDIAEAFGRVWADRYPTDLVMLVPAADTP
jgi:hypothetical protein